MINLGTRVQWWHGDHIAHGVVAACLTGTIAAPSAVITTLIVQPDIGGLEIVPESAVELEPAAAGAEHAEHQHA